MAKEFKMYWGSKLQDSIGSDLNHDDCEIIDMNLSDICLTEQEKLDSEKSDSEEKNE